MLTYVVRHGRTSYSTAYRLNGDPRIAVPLDHEGISQCQAARAGIPLTEIAVCLCSPFLRARQTAELLTAGYRIPTLVNARLGELDYGQFEGRAFSEYADWLSRHGGWTRPPGAAEAQREGIKRMLNGLRAVLKHPGPALVVTHGLPWSVLRHGTPLGQTLFFPEGPYLTPLTYQAPDLIDLLRELERELDGPVRHGHERFLGVADQDVPVSVCRAPVYREKEDFHA